MKSTSMFIVRTIAVASLMILVAPAFGQGGLLSSEEAKLTASDGAAGDTFGVSVALSGDTAVIGAWQDDIADQANAGSASVFVRTGTSWSEQAKLTATDGAAGDNFGYSVALSGDTAVVGAWSDDNAGGADAGSAYVFVRSGTVWNLQAKLTAADGAVHDCFGYSVSHSGDSVVVGAHCKDSFVGAAYVFVRSGTSWSQQAKLMAADATQGAAFGLKVAVSGDTALIAASKGDDLVGGTDVGSAYVFVRNGTNWSQQAKLAASDAAADDAFGYSIALSGDTAVIGAEGDDNASGDYAGSVYIFVRSGTSWSQQAKLTASDAAAYDYFGHAVALSGNTAVIGACKCQAGTGSAYIFVRSGAAWIQQSKLTASDGANGDHFGFSVAVSEYTVVVGANENPPGGSAYIFRFEPIGSWADIGLGTGGTAGVPELTGTGYLLAGSPVSLSLTQAKSFSLAPLVIGLSNLSAPFKGGVLVPYPSFIFPAFTDFFGKSTFGGLWPAGVPSGFTTYFQWWIQDQAGPQGYAASNAVAGTAP